MAFRPDLPAPSKSISDLAAWCVKQFQRIATASSDKVAFVNLTVQYAQPTQKFAGMVVYADGTRWNPGSGEGLYRWSTGGAWVFIG